MTLDGQKIEVCISVDDLPVHGFPHPELCRLDIARLFIQSLEKHSVRQAIGFVNGCLLEPPYLGKLLRFLARSPNGNQAIRILAKTALIDPKPYLNKQFFGDFRENKQILEEWKSAGHLLGNHTYWHSNLNKTTEDLFIKGIDLNYALLTQLGASGPKLFRYPYLREGATKIKHERVKNHLRSHDYFIVPATITFNDYAWNQAYLRSFLNRPAARERLEKKYLEMAVLALRSWDFTAHTLYGRSIKHILLLHIGALTALMLDQLLTRFEEEGVRFITAEEALNEEVYREETNIMLSGKSRSFLEQRLLSLEKNLPLTEPAIYRFLMARPDRTPASGL